MVKNEDNIHFSLPGPAEMTPAAAAKSGGGGGSQTDGLNVLSFITEPISDHVLRTMSNFKNQTSKT